MTADSACLGLEILGKCNYDPSDPSVSYFTIGQLVAVVALLLAFSQLTTPIRKFRIRARKINLIGAIFLSVCAVAFIFYAAILPFIPGKARPILGYPVFWEVLAGFIFVGVAVDLIFAISREPSFSRRNAEAYFKACGSIIAKGNDEDLRELADEIFLAVKPIFDECQSYNEFAAHQAKERGEKYHVEKATRIAFTILDLWSDKSFCRNIVCKAPVTALQIFEQLARNPSKAAGYALSQQLIHQAFVNRDSILMREEDYSGLGFFKQFRNTVFKEWRFIEGRHRPLQAWRSHEEEVTSWQVEKYIECLETSFQAYFVGEDYWQYPASLSVGLEKLAHLATDQVTRIRHETDQTSYTSSGHKVLFEIERGFQEIIKIIEEHQDKLPEYKIETKGEKKSRFDDVSIYAIVGRGIYEYFEQLAMAQSKDDLIRHYAIGIWMDVFGVGSATQSKTKVEIGKRLIEYLNKKIDQNLDPEQRWYPAITRLLLSLNGIYEPIEGQEDGQLGARFRKDFIERIRKDFPRVARRDLDFAKQLLPEDFTYDSETNEITHKRRRQKVDVLKLAPAQP